MLRYLTSPRLNQVDPLDSRRRSGVALECSDVLLLPPSVLRGKRAESATARERVGRGFCRTVTIQTVGLRALPRRGGLSHIKALRPGGRIRLTPPTDDDTAG